MFWSLKGGSGVTVVTALAAAMAAEKGHEIVLTALTDDLSIAIGVNSGEGRQVLGLKDWLGTEGDVSPEGLLHMLQPVVPRVRFLSAGFESDLSSSAIRQKNSLHIPQMAVLLDASGADIETLRYLRRSCSASYVVMRPCMLALQRLAKSEIHADGVVLIEESKRLLTRRDVQEILQVPVVATIATDPLIAGAVDVGRVLQCGRRVARQLMSLEPAIVADIQGLQL